MIRGSLLLTTMLVCLPQMARAGDPVQQLFVELVVNGRATGDLVPLRIDGTRMLVPAEALSRNGVTLDGEGGDAEGGGTERDVASLPHTRARYDAALQTLHLDTAPDYLPTTRIAAGDRPRAATLASWGAMVNYQFYAQRTDGGSFASLWSEQRVFGPVATLSNSGVLRLGSRIGGYLRYDTHAKIVNEDRALTVTAGDLITRSLPWSTSVRLGGLQLTRDFNTRPDLLTMPLPSFAGKAAVPSAVDLFVDGYRQQGADVAPGRFVLQDVPVINGAGEAVIVTTDAVGRQIATTIPFYVSSTLLRAGLTDFAAEAGAIRQGYGIRNFDYGRLAANGSIRRGMTSFLTLEAHAEATARLRQIGGGLVVAPWRFGTVALSVSASRSGQAAGHRWSLGYSYTARHFSVAAQYDDRSRGFRELASFDLANPATRRRTYRAIANVNLARLGTLGAAYISGRTLGSVDELTLRSRLLSLSYGRPVGSRANLFVTADRDFERGATSAQLRLFIPFGRNAASGGISRSAGRNLYQVGYTRATPTDGGLGIDAGMAAASRGPASGQVTGTWRAPFIEVQAGGATAQARSSAWIGASGSIVAMDGGLFVANQASDAFAVVETGVAGVGVSYENQPVGVTNRKGHLFVPNVVPYLPVRFAIDTLSLSENHVASAVEQRVAVRQGSGAVVRLNVRMTRNILAVLVDSTGATLKPGGRVQREGHPDVAIGWDGIAYLEDVGEQVSLSALTSDGTVCQATFGVSADVAALSRIGPVSCR